jgi:ABC-2 type transport system ATP-binding protein
LISPFLGSISVQYQGEAINYLDDKFTAASFTEINNDHLKSALLISNGDYDDNDIRRINKLEFNDERVFYRDAGDEYLANENVLDFEKVNFINFMQPLGQLMDSLADEETSDTAQLESNLISGHNEINFDVLEKVLTENKVAVLKCDFAKNLNVKNISDIIAVLKVMDQFHKDIYLKNNKLIFGYFGAQYPSYGYDSNYSFERYVNTIFFESSYLLKFGEIFYGNSKDEPSLYSISNLARIDVANLKSSYWKSPFIWAGKTTLIKTILGEYEKDSGLVQFLDTNNRELHSDRIAFLPDQSSYPGDLSVGEYVKYFLMLKNIKFDRKIFSAFEKEFKLENVYRKKFNMLSSGSVKKVLLIASLMSNADIYFLDEPTANMDVNSRKEFNDIMRFMIGKGKTIILISHTLEELDLIAKRVILISDGNKVFDDTLSPNQRSREVYEKFTNNKNNGTEGVKKIINSIKP